MHVELAAAVVAVATTLLVEKPHYLANEGLKAQLRTKTVRETVCRRLYRVLTVVYAGVHGRLPQSDLDRMAMACWQPTDDAEAALLASKMQLCLERLRSLCDAPVTWDDVEPQFVELYDAAVGPGFKLTPGATLGNAGRDWVVLGFQGTDPATDLRGTGRLGFEHLYSLFTGPSDTRRLLRESGSIHGSSTGAALPEQWYPFALVSIRLSGALVHVLEHHPVLLIRLFGTIDPVQEFEGNVSRIHEALVYEFHREWMEAVAHGEIRTYFDNEKLLAEFERGLVFRLWNWPRRSSR